MKVEIIVIGDEILLGRVTDTNSGFLARELDPLGWTVERVTVIGDSHAEITDAIRRGLDRADIVLTTGGLGPTRDDITKQALMDVFGGSLRHDPEVLENARRIMESRGRKFNALTATQADVPSSCRVIQNPYGTAPVMLFEHKGKQLVAMPGVPAETWCVFPQLVLPQLIALHPEDSRPTTHRSLTVAGIAESAIAELLAEWEDANPGIHLAYLPNAGIVRLRIDAVDEAAAEKAQAEIAAILERYLISLNDSDIAQTLIQKLISNKLTIATAESCTGGNIAHRLTLIPGSSAAVMGGVVSYANSVKTDLLGVDPEAIAAHGAVSEIVAGQMAEGVRNLCRADIAIATSGIAGPTGAVPRKPVGTVCMALATPYATFTSTHLFPGDRERVIERATQQALLLAIDEIKKIEKF